MAKHVYRIFVSSTFNDLKAERNALQARVFPRLRTLCESQEIKAHFQPIDLRWGVSDEASLDQQAMTICLDEIARCQETSPRPNFILLLGDRYGWMPPPVHITDDVFQQILKTVTVDERTFLENHYTLDKNALVSEQCLNPRKKGGPYEKYEDWEPVERKLHAILADAAKQLKLDGDKILPFTASATHQEIVSGAMQQEDAQEHVFCFFRSIQGLPKDFRMADFQKELADRLKKEYPKGLDESCQKFADKVLGMNADVSAKEVDDHLKNELKEIPKATNEETLLQFMRQTLTDFTAADFLNMQTDWGIDQGARDRLAALRKDLNERFGQHVYKYQAEWTGRGISTDHIDQLCEDVYNSLKGVIKAEIVTPHERPTDEKKIVHIQPRDTLKEEGLAHNQFAEERLEFFVGRTKILKDIGNYLQGGDRRILGITAGGGAGKSALMAKAVENAQKALPNAQLVYRFIGATPSSSDGRGLLDGLCREISRCYGAIESDIPIDFRDLAPELGKRMALASAEKPLMLFLDSLDQLSTSHGARGLTWLPNELPEHVKLVVSTREKEDTFGKLMSKKPVRLILEGLEVDDGKNLLGLWLKDAGRELKDEQQNEVMSKFKDSDGNPLYLKLAFEEARLWTSFQDQEELAVDVEGIIRKNMFDRLKNEGSHGEVLVSHALGYLAASRDGLAEDELVDLLSRDLEVYTWFFRQTYHLPTDLVEMAVKYLVDNPDELKDLRGSSPNDAERTALAWLKQDRNPPEPVVGFLKSVLAGVDGPRLPIVMWSRLSFDLAPYLSERMVDGRALLSFYHRELGDVSKAVFLTGINAQTFHEKLADYFHYKADPQEDRSWTGGNTHALSELPFQLISAGKRDDVFKTLTDFKFLEHKAEEVGITEHVDENGREQITSDGVHQIQLDLVDTLAAFYGGSSQEAGGGKAPLIRTAEERDGKLQVYCPVCNQKSDIARDQLGEVITCPQEECEAKLKLNTFTNQMD